MKDKKKLGGFCPHCRDGTRTEQINKVFTCPKCGRVLSLQRPKVGQLNSRYYTGL